MKRWTPFVRDKTQEHKAGGALYSNNRYHVIVHRHQNPTGGADIWHLSIRNNNRSAKRDWRDFQRIKNEFFGAETEAVEIFPAESNVVDTANQFHLWALAGNSKWLSQQGIGFTDGRIVWSGHGPLPPGFDAQAAPNAKQRPM